MFGIINIVPTTLDFSKLPAVVFNLTIMSILSASADHLYRFLLAYENGASNKEIQDKFNAPYECAVIAMNELLAVHRVQLFTTGGVDFVCKAVNDQLAAKLERMK